MLNIHLLRGFLNVKKVILNVIKEMVVDLKNQQMKLKEVVDKIYLNLKRLHLTTDDIRSNQDNYQKEQ